MVCIYPRTVLQVARAGVSDNSPTTNSSWTAHTDVLALNGSLWGSESQTNVLVPSPTTLADSGGLLLALGVQEDVWLLLESALALDSQFGGHDCGGRVQSRLSLGVKSAAREVCLEVCSDSRKQIEFEGVGLGVVGDSEKLAGRDLLGRNDHNFAIRKARFRHSSHHLLHTQCSQYDQSCGNRCKADARWPEPAAMLSQSSDSLQR